MVAGQATSSVTVMLRKSAPLVFQQLRVKYVSQISIGLKKIWS